MWAWGATALFLAAGALAAALEGGVEPRYTGPIFAFVAVLSAAVLVVRGEPSPRGAARWAAMAAIVLVLAQLVPWPRGLRRVFAPGLQAALDRAGNATIDVDAWLAAATVHDLDAAVGAPSAWTFDVLDGAVGAAWALGTTDLDGTTWTFVTLAALALVYAAGRALGTDAGALRVACVALLLLAVCEAAFGIANRSGGTIGLSAKVHYLGSASGTFVNRGHFAALLCLGLGAAWGLASELFPLLPEEVRRHRQRQRRSSQPPDVWEASGDRLPRLALIGFFTAVVALGLVASRSRGPVIGFAVAGALLAWIGLRRRDEPWHAWIAAGVPAVGVSLAMLAWGPRGAVGRFLELARDDSAVSRLSLWRESLTAWWGAPLFGWGAGAFGEVWPIHERGAHLYHTDFAHSEPVQWLVEGGIVGFVALALAVWAWAAAAWRRALEAPGDTPGVPLALGLAVGVVAVAIQSLADFPLRSLGVALPTALCAGLVHGALAPGEPGSAARGARWVTAALAALVAAGGLVGFAKDRAFQAEREQRLSGVARVWRALEQADDARVPESTLRGAVEAHVWASPLDPWGHLALARVVEGALEGTDEAGALAVEQGIARAVALRPRDPRVALAAALVLRRAGAHLLSPDSTRERVVNLAASAVGWDPWRAQAALRVCRGYPASDLVRVAAAVAAGAPAHHRARVAYELGRALEAAGERGGAADAYAEAIGLEPSFGPPAFALGAMLRADGDADGATRAFEQVVAARDVPAAMAGWARVFLGDHRTGEARLNEALALDGRNRWALEGLVWSAADRGDVDAELRALRRLVGVDPQNAAAAARLAALERGDGRAGRVTDHPRGAPPR